MSKIFWFRGEGDASRTMERPRVEPPRFDPPEALAQLQEWAAMFRNASSAAQGTDFLVFFAFLVGVEMASTHTGAAAALLDYTEEKMPSASEYVNALADALAKKRQPRVSARTLAALFSKN